MPILAGYGCFILNGKVYGFGKGNPCEVQVVYRRIEVSSFVKRTSVKAPGGLSLVQSPNPLHLMLMVHLLVICKNCFKIHLKTV